MALSSVDLSTLKIGSATVVTGSSDDLDNVATLNDIPDTSNFVNVSEYSVVGGYNSSGSGETVLLGRCSYSAGNSVVIGNYSTSLSTYATAVGQSSQAGRASVAIGYDSSAIYCDAVAVGNKACASTGGVVIGGEAQAVDATTAGGGLETVIGHCAHGYGTSVTVGASTVGQRGAVAIGYSATSSTPYSIAIGYAASAYGSECSCTSGSLAIGTNAVASCSRSLNIGINNASTASEYSGVIGIGVPAPSTKELRIGLTTDSSNGFLGMGFDGCSQTTFTFYGGGKYASISFDALKTLLVNNGGQSGTTGI